MIKKTGVIGGLDLPEKAEHTREIAFLLRNASEFIFPGIICMLKLGRLAHSITRYSGFPCI